MHYFPSILDLYGKGLMWSWPPFRFFLEPKTNLNGLVIRSVTVPGRFYLNWIRQRVEWKWKLFPVSMFGPTNGSTSKEAYGSVLYSFAFYKSVKYLPQQFHCSWCCPYFLELIREVLLNDRFSCWAVRGSEITDINSPLRLRRHWKETTLKMYFPTEKLNHWEPTEAYVQKQKKRQFSTMTAFLCVLKQQCVIEKAESIKQKIWSKLKLFSVPSTFELFNVTIEF